MRILFLLLFLNLHLQAQLSIRGIVTDKDKNPLPYVDIFLKSNKKIGASTDINGNFNFKVSKEKIYLIFSCIGFAKKTIRINPRTGFLKVILEEESDDLEEIVIVPKPKKRLKKKENPAYRILKEIWKRKRKNGLKKAKSYEYQKYLTTQVGLNNVDTLLLASLKKTLKNTGKEIPYDENARPYVPFYIKEKIYNVFGNNILEKKKSQIIAEREKGLMSQNFIFERLKNLFVNPIDIYKNDILLLRKSFVSPVSKYGFGSYDYVLYDSIQKNNRKFYRIFFFPRQDGDLAFEGHMKIADKSFAVKSITMKIHTGINLNYIRSLTIEKDYKIVNDSIFYPTKNKYKVDFTLISKNENNRGVIIEKSEIFENHIFDKKRPKAFYDEKIEKYKANQFEKSEQFWKEKTAENSKKNTHNLIETFKNNKSISTFTGFINTFFTGYFNVFPNIQMGPFWEILEQNDIEGYKFRLPFRTFKTIHDRFRLKGYFAYGEKDKKFKYALQASYLLNYVPRISLDISHSNDLVQLGEQKLVTKKENAFASQNFLNRGSNNFLSSVVENGVHLQWRLVKNLRVGLAAKYRKIASADSKVFTSGYLDSEGNLQEKITDVHSDIYLIFTPGRFVYGYGVEQRLGTNLFPTFVVNYRKSYPNFLGGNATYQKIDAVFMNPWRVGILGILDFTLQAGKIFGTVPITLLNPIIANQRISLKPGSFALLNYYDFVTDTYATAHFEHHFNGLIFNRIPFLKKLKLRSLLTFRAAYGTISKANKKANRSSIPYNTPHKIYYEYGVGIENLGYKNLRFLRIDAIWRPKNENYRISNPDNFGIRVTIKPEL